MWIAAYRFGVFMADPGESNPMPKGLYSFVGVLPRIRRVGVFSVRGVPGPIR